MSFRRMSGIRLPYRRQGLIYFTLLSYEDMGKKGKKRIDAKLLEAAYGEEAFAAALRDWCCGKMTVQAGQAIDLIGAVAVQTAERIAKVGQNGPCVAEIDHIVGVQRLGIGHAGQHPLPQGLHELRHGGGLCTPTAVKTVHVQLTPGEDRLCQPDKVRLQRLGPRPGNKRPQIAAVKDAVLINGSVEIEDDDPVLHGGPPFVRRLAGSCG